MKKNIKLLALLLTAALILGASLSLAGCAEEKPIIGIMQFGTHESLNNCYDGIIAGLKDGGIDVEKYEIKLLNDNFDPAVSQTHANNLVNSGADIIIAIATPSAVAAANAAAGDVPVVFCAITDGTVMENYTNVTGSSDRPNFDKQLALVRSFLGDGALKVGTLLSTNEDSSPYQLSELIAAAERDGNIEIVSQTVADISTIGTQVDKLIDADVDCIVNLLDNTIVGKLDIILDAAANANIPVFGSEIEQVKAGCAASASIEYLDVGKEAGKLAAQILLGNKAADDLDVKIVSEPKSYYNSDVCKKLGITVPDDQTLIDVCEDK